MGDGSALFCTRCGGPLSTSDRFCTRCGSPRSLPVSGQPATAQPAAVIAGVVGVATGAASMAAGLPWQTIVAGETPDLRAMLSGAAVPAARSVVQRSLKRPGLSMAATVVLDVLVAGISGGPAALVGAIPRALGGGLTALLSLITGSKGGALRGLTGVVSLITALVQVVSLGGMLLVGLAEGTSLLALVPMAVATASALVMALKTASVALRRRVLDAHASSRPDSPCHRYLHACLSCGALRAAGLGSGRWQSRD